MKIWEQRYTNQKGKTETKKGFDLFQIYLDMTLPRTLPKFVCEYCFNGNTSKELKKSKEFIRKYNSIYKFYKQFDWDERATAHDVYIRQRNDEALIQQFNEFRLQELPNAMKRVSSHNERFDRINENDTEVVVTKEGLKERPKRDSDRTRSEKENQESYSLAVDDVIKIFTGGVVRTENKNESNVQANVKTELSKETIFDIVDKELDLNNE